ncbi:MAG: thioredoxin [Holosporales bacterium]|jgi:thioredoxin 1|nr:thioredoxin [Holosporales bacterium]
MIEINNMQDFDNVTRENPLVLIDFWATWCGPCRMLVVVLEEIAKETSLTILKVNIDEAPDISDKFNIQSVPTLILFKNGQEISSKCGFLSKSAVLSWINENNSR